MASVELFQEPIRRRYYAPYLSCSYLFFLVTVWILICLPFFLSYSGDFWLKTNTYREQPANIFEYKLIVQASGPQQSDNFFYSSVPKLNTLNSDSLRMCTVRSIESDNNLDSIPDSFRLEIDVPLAASEGITKFDALVFFRTQLQQKAKVVMESVIHIGYDSSLAGAGLYSSGNMVLSQAMPLPVRGGYTTMYESHELLHKDKVVGASDGDIRAILEKLSARNLTMVYEGDYSYWTPAPTSALSSVFKFVADIKIPTMEVTYIPTAVEVLRNAWIQYLSMFVVVGFFLEKVCSFVYFHQIVETKMLVETVGSNVGVPHFKRF
mmetsp:Transcript_18266/g.36532  ORF Transcript_18266/g.36532 Transcript_18266/m.36532 type:complete len:322 (+) Transcript_18266:156-1121(+)|eukprot:CAMPEP_0182456806 /NCGR_PEP_ID=MMETSP1319-20130603/2542_1 /TAXON_ID=172717 /ORGANISM="Bolidomonas pacifica, Strain RCC208" /LENGTH=321 /DNA_ID=CAMNT_0024655127 /DNA_START=346 /DNA_END=1311 /DNA_ORIENTATION=+